MYHEVFRRNIESKVYENRQTAWTVLKQGLYNADITQAEYDELAELVNQVYTVQDEAPDWHETAVAMMADIIKTREDIAIIFAILDGSTLPPEPAPSEDYPQWVMPEAGKWDKYGVGAKVYHKGKYWQSKVAYNVWEPSVDSHTAWEVVI